MMALQLPFLLGLAPVETAAAAAETASCAARSVAAASAESVSLSLSKCCVMRTSGKEERSSSLKKRTSLKNKNL